MTVLISNAFKNLRYALLRSLLTLLGVIVGVAVGVAVINIGHSTEKSILSQFESLGAYVVTVNYLADKPADMKELLLIQERLKSNANILDVALSLDVNTSLLYQGRAHGIAVHAVSENFLDITRVKLAKGRKISKLDGRQAYGLLSDKFYQNLDENSSFNSNNIGKKIALNSTFFTLIGFVGDTNNQRLSSIDLNNTLFVPLESLRTLELTSLSNTFTLLRKKEVDYQIFINELNEFFADLSIDDVYISSHEDVISSIKEQRTVVGVAFLLISIISILAGGIGIMNIMLVSVAERRKEIGLRLAVGANPRDIKFQFLTEAILLCFIGGCIGILLGIIFAYCFTWYFDSDFFLSFGSILVGFLSSSLIGLLSGYYPAAAAAKLSPVETLYRS